MGEQDQFTRWVIGLTEECEADAQTTVFIESACMAWPRVLRYTHRELLTLYLNRSESTSLAQEIWEEVLRSVWKTLRQGTNSGAQIHSLENYLIGTYRHRLARRLKEMRLRNAHLEYLPPEELAEVQGIGHTDEHFSVRIHDEIQLDKVYATLGEDMKRAFLARTYGFSWSEIAKRFAIGEQTLIMRMQYAIRRARSRLNVTR